MKCRQKYAVKPPSVEEGAQRLIARGPCRLVEQRARPPVEARHLGQHPEEAGAAQVPPGREQSAQAERAGVLQAGRLVAHRHRHLRRLRADADLGEEAQQRRVGALVVDDEAGVDGEDTAVRVGDVVGVGVAAEPGVGLVERDVGVLGRHMCRRQPRHAGSDDRDPSWSAHVDPSPPVGFSGKSAIGSEVGLLEPLVGLDGDRSRPWRWRRCPPAPSAPRRPASGRPRPCPSRAAGARAGTSYRSRVRGRPCRSSPRARATATGRGSAHRRPRGAGWS